MNPIFTVVIPVYNVEKYINKCIESVINQTFKDIEIVLIDDGSTDNCPQICDSFAANDDRIVVIHKSNGGLSDARNTGLQRAKGEYIIFLDSDDYIERDTCEKLLPFVKYKYDIISGDAVTEGAKKHLTHDFVCKPCSGKEFLKKALQCNSMPMAVWLYIYRREFLLDNKLTFKCGIAHEDEHFTPRSMLMAQKVVNTNVLFYHYVIRENSITNRKDLRKNAEDLLRTCLELKNVYDEVDDYELKRMLVDSLATKLLSQFQAGKLYQYGRKYCPKYYVWKFAKKTKTRLKALLFCLSPKVYWHINNMTKKLGLEKQHG